MKKKFYALVDRWQLERHNANENPAINFEVKVFLKNEDDILYFEESLLKGFNFKLERKVDLNKLSPEELEEYVKANKSLTTKNKIFELEAQNEELKDRAESINTILCCLQGHFNSSIDAILESSSKIYK